MTAPTENRPGQGDSTYEDFTNRPFYVEINKKTVSLLPPSRTVVDIATGTGAIIQQMIEQDKLLPGFWVNGFDIDPVQLQTAEEKFEDVEGGIIEFELAPAENLPMPSNEDIDLVTFCNAVHLTDPITSFQEAQRILKPRGILAINTAYPKDYAYPEGPRKWGMLVALAIRTAREKYGIDVKEHPSQEILQHTSSDYVELAKNAGFTNISIGRINVQMDKEDLEAICRYKEFAEGAMPGIEYETAKDCLLEAVEQMFAKKEGMKIARGWMVMYAFKASDSEMDELPNPEEKRDQISLSDARSIY